MYEEYYGLKAPPFNITPDPAYLYFSRRHRQAFEHILFGVSERKGFIQITGEIGAGKSTLCRKVLEELREGYATALILNPVMTPIQLMRSILRELHLDDSGNDRIRLVERLNDFLLEKAHAGVIVALFIEQRGQPPADLGKVDTGSIMHLGCIQAAGPPMPEFPDRLFDLPARRIEPFRISCPL